MNDTLIEIGEIANEEIDVGAISKYLHEFPDKAVRFGVRVLIALIVLFIGIQLIKLIRSILRKSLKRGNADAGVIQFLDSFIKVILYVILIFMIASNFGLDATSVIALLGSAGVAIGLAVQGSLSNFAGGVLILLLKPFKVGDYIRAESSHCEGTVKEIQLFYTKLVTPDNHVVIVANGTLSNSNIMNMSMLAERRIDIICSISYNADIQKARDAILAILQNDEKVLQDMEKRVFVSELADSGVLLGVRCFSKNEDYWDTKWRLTERVKIALDQAGIEIPYPQLDVHMNE